MIKRISLLGKSGVLSIGLSAACLALACGNEAPTDDPDPTVEPPPDVPPANECETNPYIEDCDDENEPPVTGAGGTGGTTTEPPDPPPGSETDLPKAQAENILLTNCGACHGSRLTEQSAQARMNYIDDLDQLAENGQIVPLDADASPIIQRMRDGSMPPGGPRVKETDIDFVANYINESDNWPTATKTTCNDNPALNFDELYEAVARDLQEQDEEDAPFIRYISLDNRAAAGICTDTALDIERQYFESLWVQEGGDFAAMARVLLGDASHARKVQLRFNQMGLKVRELKEQLS